MEGNELQTKARKFHRSTRRPEEPWCTSFETPFDRLAHLTRSLFASVFTSTLSTRQTMQHTWTSDSRVVLCFVLKPVFSVVLSAPTNESGPLSVATKAALHWTSFSHWDHKHNSKHLEWNCFQFPSLCIICGWKYIYTIVAKCALVLNCTRLHLNSLRSPYLDFHLKHFIGLYTSGVPNLASY